MEPSIFLQRLVDRGLSLSLGQRTPDGVQRLVLSGDKTQPTEGIYKYIGANRALLIELLTSQVTDDQCFIPCHLVQYGICTNQVIELNESTWRMSLDGTVFCVQCWENRHIERAEKALPWLVDRGLPIDLGDRIEQLMAGPGYGCCGGYDWGVDWTGALVCHHVIEAFERIKREQAA